MPITRKLQPFLKNIVFCTFAFNIRSRNMTLRLGSAREFLSAELPRFLGSAWSQRGTRTDVPFTLKQGRGSPQGHGERGGGAGLPMARGQALPPRRPGTRKSICLRDVLLSTSWQILIEIGLLAFS